MFGIIDILVLILIRRRHCIRCGRSFWAAPPHSGADISIGRESYICVCGNRYETRKSEWAHLSREQKREYLWSGLVAIPAIITSLAAVVGYFLRWHEPYWVMALILGFLGLLSGLICSALLLILRALPVVASMRRSKFDRSETGAAVPG
jgi:hypothetical protein